MEVLLMSRKIFVLLKFYCFSGCVKNVNDLSNDLLFLKLIKRSFKPLIPKLCGAVFLAFNYIQYEDKHKERTKQQRKKLPQTLCFRF